VAALWTDAPGCGGVEYYDADAGPGARYQSLTAGDFTTWGEVSGEATHRIVLDAGVAPAERTDWSSIKASYR
jgi:hypothetical protein